MTDIPFHLPGVTYNGLHAATNPGVAQVANDNQPIGVTPESGFNSFVDT